MPGNSRKSPEKKAYRSKIAKVMHETMTDFYEIGLVNKTTMRGFDLRCLTSIEPLSPKQIAALRRRENVSQGIFALALNVKPKLVSEWERGEKKPSGPSLKLLSLVKAKGLDAII